MPISQTNRPLAINTTLGEDKLALTGATMHEQLGRLYQIDVDLTSEDPNLDFNSLVGSNATIRLLMLNSKTPRYFNGYINRFVQTEALAGGGVYRATLVPWLWFLTRTADCRIFQTKSVPDIIKQVFRDQGFTDFKDSLSGTYTAWDYCVQYRETDFNFISRLMEHEGIYYFFEHENGKHTLVLADSSSAHSPYEGYENIAFRSSRGGTIQNESISTWALEQEVQPGTYALNDFNFEKPKTSLVGQSNISTQNAQSTFSVYDYPGEYAEQSEGSDYAKLRIEEMHVQHEVVHGNTNARGLAVGNTFTLTSSPRRDQNRKYLVTSATHQLTAEDYSAGGMGNSAETFSCNFQGIDATKSFRAARTTPKPLIQGPQTAIVVGPSGEEIHTDTYGRVKVQFHWDRYGKADENSSCWVRVSQAAWAGKKWGAMYIPRVGHEVIVEFLEGDPDLPIITGRVYNADHTPPYDLPAQKTKSTLKSSSSKGGTGFNELRFEDKKGSEQVFIHAEKNMDTRVKADSLEAVGNERHLIVEKDHFEHSKADLHQEIGGNHNVKIGETLSLKAGMNVQEKVGMNYALDAGMEVYLKGGMTVTIEAGMELTLKGAGGFITIGPAGIAISGTMVLINSGGAPGSGSPPQLTDPKPALAADDDQAGSKGDPTALANTKTGAGSSVLVPAKSDEAPTESDESPAKTTDAGGGDPFGPAATALQQAADNGTPLVEQCPLTPPAPPPSDPVAPDVPVAPNDDDDTDNDDTDDDDDNSDDTDDDDDSDDSDDSDDDGTGDTDDGDDSD